MRLQSVNAGFTPDHLLTATLELPRHKYEDDALTAQFFRQVVERVGGLPGVEAAAAVSHLPLSGKRRA
jgi:hypothetical protein